MDLQSSLQWSRSRPLSKRRKNEYTDAVQAVANLADDASDAVRLGAEENVLAAANAYLEALEDADAVHSEVTRVEGLVTSARGARDATQTRIDDAAKLARRMAPINPEAKAFQKAVKGAIHSDSPEGNTTETVTTNYFAVTGMKVTAAPTQTDSVGDVPGFGQFGKSNKIAPEAAHEGWRGGVYERSRMTAGGPTFTTSDDKVTSDRVTVYSTQADAGDKYYSEYYGGENNAIAGEKTVDVAGEDGEITLDPMQNEAGGYAKASAFPTAGRDITYDGFGDNPPIPTGRGAFPGTYRGIAGVFACDTGCTATAGHTGNITVLGGTWTFTPDGDPATLVVRGVDPDTDYLTMGHWVRTVTTDGKPAYTVGVFVNSGSGAAALDGNVNLATGSAMYVGPAVGLFSKREHAPGGDGAITMSGQFTADANLVADFGLDATDFGFVNGTIDNFMHRGTAIDSDWEVTMTRAEISDGDADAAAGTFGQTGGAANDGSNWAGSFYKQGADRDGDGDGTARMPPGYVAGTFDNAFDNGDVIGAFGASKQKE